MKPLADYTPEEALREIRSITENYYYPEEVQRIDMLAGHLMLLAMNAESRYREHVEASEAAYLRARGIANDLDALISDTRGRKTVQRDRVVDIAARWSQ